MNNINNQVYSLEQAANLYLGKTSSKTASDQSKNLSFDDILRSKADLDNDSQVVFSKHANDRLASRNINLTEEQVERLNKGVEQARGKNINESLVVMDDLAFIVSVNNNTVITALDQGSSDNNVFTNIDGAVII